MILRFLSKALTVFVLVLVLISEAQPCPVPVILDETGNVPKVVDVIVGKDVRLNCEVKENGVNTSWLKNNETISPSDHPRMRLKFNKYLKIKRVQKDDAGFYTCVAENGCGRNLYKIQLLVGNPTISPTNITGEKPQFLYPTRMEAIKSTYTEGDQFILTCEAKGIPAPVVTWFKNDKMFSGRHRAGEFLEAGKYDYRINFFGVDIADAGNYTCIVSNMYGRLTYSYNFNVTERVRSVPQIFIIWKQEEPIYAGSNLELFCIVLTKDPKTRYRWYYRDSDVPEVAKLGTLVNQSLYELTPNQNEYSWPKWKLKLQLKNVSVADSGLYGCQAENVLGNASRETYLNVTIRLITPSLTGMPTVNAHNGEKPEKESAWTNKTLIGVLAGLIVLAIIAAGVCYWQVKKALTSSSTAKSRRRGIDSLRAKYEVQNEYVVVPDYIRNV